jgi:hypothetical protein
MLGGESGGGVGVELAGAITWIANGASCAVALPFDTLMSID